MSVTSLETIHSEAEEAARAGKTPDEACRWPFDSPQGLAWKERYHAEREALESATAGAAE